MAQKRIITFNATQSLDEDLYEKVEFPKPKEENKRIKTRGFQHSTARQKHSTDNSVAPRNKVLIVKWIVSLTFILSVFVFLLTIIILASASINLLRNTQVRCPDLEPLGNGSVAITSGAYVQLGLGAVANYSCNSGFMLRGLMIRGCRLSSDGEESTGTWNATKPSCQAIIVCPTLESPTNGQVQSYSGDKVDNLVVGSVLTFSCNPGFVIAGQQSLRCTNINNEGKWTGNEPTCQHGSLLDCHDTTCRSTKLSCTGDGHCRISCNDTQKYTCHNSSIVCSQSESGCTVACDESYACLQSVVHCPRVGDCNVNCLGPRACTRATATCQNGKCEINCNGQYSCEYSVQELSSVEKSYVGCRGVRACQYMNLACPIGGDCFLSCDNSYSCYDATLSSSHSLFKNIECRGLESCYRIDMMFASSEQAKCSGSSSCRYTNMKSRNLMCTGSSSCQYGSLVCNSTNSCNIDCLGSSSCYNTNYDCSNSNNCEISCTAPSINVCRYTTFNCPSFGTCNINCTGSSACRSARFESTGTGRFNITCMDVNACRSATLMCPVGEACELFCNGSSACYDARMDCSSSSSCDITCLGQSSCQYLQMSCPPDNSCALSCSGSSSCSNSRLVCPTDEPCNINCDGVSACYNLQQLTCPDRDLCSITCSGLSSCRNNNNQFNCPINGSCSYQCSGQSSCSSSTIRCSNSESCTLACTGEEACQSTNIYCPDNSDCTVMCSGREGCSNANVYCPAGNYKCVILCTDPLSCSSLRIINTHNVDLRCCGRLACQRASISPSSYGCKYNKEL